MITVLSRETYVVLKWIKMGDDCSFWVMEVLLKGSVFKAMENTEVLYYICLWSSEFSRLYFFVSSKCDETRIIFILYKIQRGI